MTKAVPRKLTYEDYLLFPKDDGLRHELIDGEHFVTPAPPQKHQIASINLSYFFVGFLRKNRLGRVFAAPFDVVLSNIDVVEPDLVFFSKERAGVLNSKNAQGAPDLAIEIFSESTRDRDETRKLSLYERFGVREYWLVDPISETARLYRREGGHLLLVQEISAAQGDFLETPLATLVPQNSGLLGPEEVSLGDLNLDTAGSTLGRRGPSLNGPRQA